MAKEFDILLHRHLTECEILVQSIPYRDGITVTSRMILNAVLNGCKLIRIASGGSDMELDARLDKIVKNCRELLTLPVVLDAAADFKAISIASPDSVSMIIGAENTGTLATTIDHIETGMILSAQPLSTKIAKSLGQASSPIILDTAVSGTAKRSLLAPRSGIELDAGVGMDIKTGILDIASGMNMDAALASLCSRVGFDAAAAMEMTAILLGIRSMHSLGRAYSGIAMNAGVSGTTAQKYEVAETAIQIAADAQPILIEYISPQSDAMALDGELTDTQLKRYRLLEEIDDYSLGDIDDMTLDELDYIILAG